MQNAPEVEAFVHTFYDALKRGDAFGVAEFLSREATEAVGTDPAEFWTGWGSIAGAFAAQMETLGGLPLLPGKISAHREDDIGWFADRPVAIVGDRELPLRLTGVARLEHGVWRLVQCHMSLGVDNTQAIGFALPV
jgi:hypothetical protein